MKILLVLIWFLNDSLFMTMKAMIEGVREISKHHPEGRLAAIRFLRRQGLTFHTARNMAGEIIANKPWYRKSLYKNDK